VIYYFGIVKERLEKDTHFHKNPAQHLNDIFINTERSEDSNKPKRVKHKRRKTLIFDDMDSQSSTEEDSGLSSDDGQDIIHLKKNQKNNINFEKEDEPHQGSIIQIEKQKAIPSIKKNKCPVPTKKTDEENNLAKDKKLIKKKEEESIKYSDTRIINKANTIGNSLTTKNNVSNLIMIDQIILDFTAHIPI